MVVGRVHGLRCSMHSRDEDLTELEHGCRGGQGF